LWLVFIARKGRLWIFFLFDGDLVRKPPYLAYSGSPVSINHLDAEDHIYGDIALQSLDTWSQVTQDSARLLAMLIALLATVGQNKRYRVHGAGIMILLINGGRLLSGFEKTPMSACYYKAGNEPKYIIFECATFLD